MQEIKLVRAIKCMCTQECIWCCCCCCYCISLLKWLFFFFFFTFWTKIFIHEYLMLSRIIYVSCAKCYLYTLFYHECEPESEFIYACTLYVCIACIHVTVHMCLCIFLSVTNESKYRMQNVSLLVNLYIFESRKSQRIHKNTCHTCVHGSMYK